MEIQGGRGTLREPPRHGHRSVSPLCRSTKRRWDSSGSIFSLRRLFWKVSSARSGEESGGELDAEPGRAVRGKGDLPPRLEVTGW